MDVGLVKLLELQILPNLTGLRLGFFLPLVASVAYCMHLRTIYPSSISAAYLSGSQGSWSQSQLPG